MPFKGEVIADGSGVWVGNALVFNTEQEAHAYVTNLRARWWLVTNTRVVPAADNAIVNAQWNFDLDKLGPILDT